MAIDASSPYVPVDIPSTLRSILEENDGYLRVQLRIGGADSEVHDLPWEYLALPWSDGGPLAADDRTPFARTIGRRAPGFRPLDVLPIRMLLVLEEALVEDPRAIEKPEKTRAVVGQAMDALSDLTARSPLHLTLLTGPGFAATDTHSSQIKIASISLSAFRTQLGQYQIAHFVPGLPAEHREEWSVQKGLRAFFGFDRKEEAEGVSVNTEDASVVPGFESLGMSLSAARRLPPFLVLPTEFARQGQSGQLVDFMGQGVAAILELPETATDRYWTGMQLFYNSLFEHGILDIAANQLRRFWLRMPERLLRNCRSCGPPSMMGGWFAAGGTCRRTFRRWRRESLPPRRRRRLGQVTRRHLHPPSPTPAPRRSPRLKRHRNRRQNHSSRHSLALRRVSPTGQRSQMLK